MSRFPVVHAACDAEGCRAVSKASARTLEAVRLLYLDEGWRHALWTPLPKNRISVSADFCATHAELADGAEPPASIVARHKPGATWQRLEVSR